MTQPLGAWQQPPFAKASIGWIDASGNTNRFTFDAVLEESWEGNATVTEHPVEVGADVTDHVRVQLRTVKLHVWATNEPMDGNNWDQATTGSVDLDIPGATWEPGPGTVTYEVWNNPIVLRSLIGAVAGFAGQAIGAGLGGAQTGQLAGDIAALVADEVAFLALPASATPQTTQTDAGLEPPVAQTLTAQVQQWPGGAEGTDYVAKTISALKLLKDDAQLLAVTGSKDFCGQMVLTGFAYTRSKDTGSGADIMLELREVRTVTTQTVPAPIPDLPAGGGAPPVNKGKQDASDATVQVQTSTAYAIAQALGPHPGPGILSLFLPPGPGVP